MNGTLGVRLKRRGARAPLFRLFDQGEREARPVVPTEADRAGLKNVRRRGAGVLGVRVGR